MPSVQGAALDRVLGDAGRARLGDWVRGGGTLVTGGEEVDGKHRGGVERQVKVGDVIFIPAGIYHGMKDTRLTTWLNIRFPEHRN